ncbi:ABC transporter transmembrane domain-containing protein [Parachitinimonas caeni]|uniref:ABC transporter transmembrane domain-containing protein n=1 Tax=Parachitinimonas caeni TaxID=3031301 RepID=A0ABT7DY29_9NEIS|nr:ABC transporter transmembrane domain-containing protein [Parachitinimonas caeni]MDK2124719.1 ABC transporter transmembrane domain-containing protein [Parachitinimonas caeni]
MTLFQLIGGFVRQHWRPYLLSALMLAGIASLNVLIPRKVGAMVDGLVAAKLTGPALWWQLASIVAMGGLIYLFRVGWRLQLFSASYQLGVQLRSRFYQRLAMQGPGFFQKSRTGDLMALATNDVDAVEMALGEGLLAGFDGLLTLLLVLAMMSLGVDWRLTLVALLPFPLMGMAYKYISTKVHLASRDALARFSDLNDHVQETLSGVRTVRALGLERRTAAEFAGLTERAAQASLNAQRWEAAFEPVVGVAMTTAVVLTLAVGGYFVWHGSLTIGKLTSFSMYLGLLVWPMFASGWVISLIERGRAAWERIQPILNEPLSIDDHGTLAPVVPGVLAMQAVQFSYPGQQGHAVSGVSLTVAPGQTLGIVGPTGAGKSTLVRLLLRQYAPQSGRLHWNGHALEDYQLEALHQAMAWVPQESFLFSASVADNIALGKPGASRQEIESVARLASVHDDILRLPKGYDTPVGERGVTLSGGQRQRVAIARALLADAPLLLLDDALSAVDTETETRILGNLREARRGRTVIIISHRLSAVMDADQILVLREGQITEAGQHEALVALDGWYASQWRYQQLEASLDAL